MISTFESKLPNTHIFCMRQAERECEVPRTAHSLIENQTYGSSYGKRYVRVTYSLYFIPSSLSPSLISIPHSFVTSVRIDSGHDRITPNPHLTSTISKALRRCGCRGGCHKGGECRRRNDVFRGFGGYF